MTSSSRQDEAQLQAYAAGRELLEVLEQRVQPKDLAKRIAALAARLAGEARAAAAAAEPTAAANGAAKGAPGPVPPAACPDFSTATAVLEGVAMTSPWGKHDIGFAPEHLLLRSSQRIIAIPFAAIQHVAILEQIPKEPKDKNCVVLALRRDSDVRAGKTRLDVVVAQTKASPVIEVAVPPGCEHLADGPTLRGPAAVVLCQLLGAHLPDIQDDTFTSSDPAVFRAASGDLAVSTNVRTAGGWLFPLPGALLFLGKPAQFIRHSEVAGCEFARVGATSSTFDLEVRLTGLGQSGGKGARVEFGQMDRGDLPRLQAYVAERRLPVGPPDPNAAPRDVGSGKGRPAAAAAAGAGAVGGGGGSEDDDSDEEDSDFNPEASGREERTAKRRRTGGSGDEGGAPGSGEGEEDDDGDDGDSDAGSSDDGSGSGDGSSSVSLVNSEDLSEDGSGGAAGGGPGDDDDDD